MIELKDVNKSFKGKQVLKHVSLTIQDGETLAIIGGSGSGKSTLLRLMINSDGTTTAASQFESRLCAPRSGSRHPSVMQPWWRRA